MSLIKEIMEGAEKINAGAQPLEYLLRLCDALQEEMVNQGKGYNEASLMARAAFERVNEEMEEEGY